MMPEKVGEAIEPTLAVPTLKGFEPQTTLSTLECDSDAWSSFAEYFSPLPRLQLARSP
jgi:hypothetical protein